jgi:membrane-associated protease RseP (regulator of RpoE activity)
MRRFRALLIAAGFAAAPVGAIAEPSRPGPPPTVERFEWSTSKGRLGVMVIGVTPELRKHLGAAENRGVLVARVEPGSAAAIAGLRVGDVIVEVHDRGIESTSDVLSALAGVNKGQDVSLKIVRDKKPITLNATLTDDPPPKFPASSWLRDFMRSFTGPGDSSWFEQWFGPQKPEIPHLRSQRT